MDDTHHILKEPEVIGCSDSVLYDQVENAIQSKIASDGSNVGPLAQSIIITSNMMDLNQTLGGANLGVILGQITEQQRRLLNINAFYIFFPIFVVILIGIWLMVGFSWISWPIGLFLSVLVFILLYTFSVLYRIQVYDVLYTQNQEWQSDTTSLAYLGLADRVTSATGGVQLTDEVLKAKPRRRRKN